MKHHATKRVLVLLLTLAMLLPNFAGAMPAVRADTVTAEPNVYDIYDLTGSETNTIKGTDETWDGQIHANVSAEHKENIVFKTKLTMGEQEIRLSVNALDGASIYDPSGYSVFINHNGGAPYIAIKRNMQDLVMGSVASVAGTWELEIGLVDILTGGVRTGKHIYVKKDGVVVCEADDVSGYLTGDALGTKFVDFHYGAAIQMDTTYGNEYGTATVYDIYDLTGATANTIKGTDETWDGQIYADVSAEHKENVAIKTKLTMGEQELRLSLNALSGANIYDPSGYSVFINHNGGAPYIAIKRNMQDLVMGSVASVAGTWELEIGLVDILTGGVRTGKHIYVKKDGVVVCEADDVSGYLTGDALGTKFVDFHYGAAIQMDTTYSNSYGSAKVYDIYDLTGVTAKQVDAWAPTQIGSFAAEDKEQAALQMKMNITNERHRYRFAVGNTADGNVWDPKGYGIEIAVDFDGQNHIRFLRNGSQIAQFADVSGLLGEHVYEFGYRNITMGSNMVGKQIYLKVDGTVLYSYDDASGYLTGDALGNTVTLNHIDNSAVALNTAYENAYGEAEIYDIYDLTGSASNTVNGTGKDNWSATVLGNIEAADKEAVSLKANVKITDEAKYRFSLGALAGDDCVDASGYGFELNLGTSGYVAFIRGSSHTWIKSWNLDTTGLKGEYLLEFGYRDVLFNGNVIGKQVFLKKDGQVLYSYDDVDGYLTGDALGTKAAIFHYGSTIQMNTTYETAVGQMTGYDVQDLTKQENNVFYGTTGSSVGGHDEWVGTTIGNVSAEHKENVNFRAKVTIPAGVEIRFSLGALESANAVDYAGYALMLKDGDFIFYRNNKDIFVGSADVTGTYVLDFGIQDVKINDQVVAKRITLKKDGQVIGTYDDASGYLTGDTLGTKLAVFHYGSSIEMNTTVPGFVNSYNLALGGSTVMKLRLDPAVIGDLEAAVTASVGGVNTTYVLKDLPIDAQGMRVVSVNLAAAEMRDPVTLTVTLPDGQEMTKTYTVAGYAKAILNGTYTAEQKAVVEAMLHYGAAAQKYFKHDADNPANEGYTDNVNNIIGSTFSPVLDGKVSGVIYYGTTLLMGENISLRHYLKISGDVSGCSFAFNGKKVTPVSASNIPGANYYVQLDDILPNELDDAYILTVSDGSSSFSLNYSPMSYVQRMCTKDNTKELVQQLYDYHIAAKTLAASKVVDSATVLDLYQISGKTSVTIPANQVMQLGVLVGTEDSFIEKELSGNVAIRFKYTGFEGMRLQLGANAPELGVTAGALFMSVPDNNSFGIANITDNGTWCKDAAGNDLFSWQACLGRDQVSYIELGCVRRYTDGVYTHDRYYVRAAASLAELDEMAQNGTFSVYYDSAMKDNNGHLVMIRSRMDNGGDLLETTWTAAQIEAYEATVNTIAQSATSGSYDELAKKYPSQVDIADTAASAATATKPASTEATGGDELILWAESGTAKIVQDDDGRAATLAAQKNTLAIQMAKNEDEGAQLMLFGNRNVSYEVFVTDLVNGSHVISADNIRLYQLKYLSVDDKIASDITYDTPSIYAGEKLPDGMLPFAKAVEYGENRIIAGNNQAIYVDVSTESTDAAGTYTGTIVVKTNTDQVYTLPIRVTVQDVVMPETSALGTYAPYLGRDSFTSGELDGSDEMAALYAQTLADYNMSSIVPASDGVMNIEKFLVELRRSYGEITNYLLPVDNTDSYYTVDGTNTLVYCNYALLKEYVVAVAEMSIADGKNYLDKAFFYPSDHVDESITEEEYNLAKATYQAFCQMLDDADAELTAKYAGTSKYSADIASSVKNLRFLLTVPVDDASGKALDVGTLLTEFLASADRKNVVLCTTNSVLTREGYGEDVATAMNGAYADELWTYLSLKPFYPHSNYAFDTPVVGLRALGWICYQENVDTLMTWKSVNYLYGTDGLSLDRWTTSSAGTNSITPGDGNIFYPGAKYGIDGPCPSLRAMAWRDGVDDYNLMNAVAENGGSADSLNSLYALITMTYSESIKASSETGSWWGSLISKKVNATVPIDDDAKFTIVRNALLQMAASDASEHAAIISSAQSAISGVVSATGTVSALEAPEAEVTTEVNSNRYGDGYYQLADFETYAEAIQNKYSGNAQLALSSLASNGNYSLKVAVQPGQKGETVWIPTTSEYFSATTDFSGASKITFKVYNGQDAESTVRFYLNTYDRSGDVYNAGTYNKADADVWHDDHPNNTSFRFTLAPGWNEITIHAADIGTDYLSYVGAFVIAFDGGAGFTAEQVFYLDDVRVYMSKVA